MTEGKSFFAHSSAVLDPDIVIGQGTRIWHFCHVLTGSQIGERCVLGQNVMVGPDVRIGSGCKIQNNVSVYRGVTLEDDVFCGPSAVFTNVINPRAFIDRSGEVRPTLVRRGATIGANATIVCGVIIGAYAMIGAGSVVSRDVPDHALVVGVPARFLGWVSRSGERLDEALTCPSTGERYELRAGILTLA
ncbi:MAG: acyltransferase [Rhizomicrobium sp.]|jgi:UDP-2-acetamido-3-amino-2,3-dideoxy-glucuronate N-acetyltransferase